MIKTINTQKTCTCWFMKFLEDFRMGYKISSEIWMGYEFLEKKLYILPLRSQVLIMTSPLDIDKIF